MPSFSTVFSLLHMATKKHVVGFISTEVSCHRCVIYFSSQQDAVEENEQRKKQEEAMREKLLAQEAKQHDPKVQPRWMNSIMHLLSAK